MKTSRILPVLALAAMMVSCVKPDSKEIHFSVLGDSFSAYEGTVDPETNDVYPYNQAGLTGPEQMWFSQVSNSTGWVIERNNSFSGALICNFDDYNSGSYFAPYSYLCRMDNLGHPDVIFVFGGTNDIYRHTPLGDYVYDNWTTEQLCAFRPGLAYLFDGLKRQYPLAELYCLIDMELCINDSTIDDETRQAFIESMHRVAEHYQVKCIDIYGIKKTLWHPDVEGQEIIASQVIEALEIDFNI